MIDYFRIFSSMISIYNLKCSASLFVELRTILNPSGIRFTMLEKRNFNPNGDSLLLFDRSSKLRWGSFESSLNIKLNFSAKSSLIFNPLRSISRSYLSRLSIKKLKCSMSLSSSAWSWFMTPAVAISSSYSSRPVALFLSFYLFYLMVSNIFFALD